MGKIDLSWLRGTISIKRDPVAAETVHLHLQIERSLSDLVRSLLKDPDKFDFSRLSFPTKTALARALVGPQEKDCIWTLALKFNELRNSLAHTTKKAPQEKHHELEAELRRLVPELTLENDDDVVFYAALACVQFFEEIQRGAPKLLL